MDITCIEMISNRELIEGLLKRVNALTGADGKLYHDVYGWFVVWKKGVSFSQDSRSINELISYLHGIEDAFLSMKGNYNEKDT